MCLVSLNRLIGRRYTNGKPDERELQFAFSPLA
jgi:hypothetical protein